MLINSSPTPPNCLNVGTPAYHMTFMRHARFQPVLWRGGVGEEWGRGVGTAIFRGLMCALHMRPTHPHHRTASNLVHSHHMIHESAMSSLVVIGGGGGTLTGKSCLGNLDPMPNNHGFKCGLLLSPLHPRHRTDSNLVCTLIIIYGSALSSLMMVGGGDGPLTRQTCPPIPQPDSSAH